MIVNPSLQHFGAFFRLKSRLNENEIHFHYNQKFPRKGEYLCPAVRAQGLPRHAAREKIAVAESRLLGFCESRLWLQSSSRRIFSSWPQQRFLPRPSAAVL